MSAKFPRGGGGGGGAGPFLAQSLYEIKVENQKKKSNWDFYLSGIGKKTYFLALGMGPNLAPKLDD